MILMQAILLGHTDSYTRDKMMQVTIAYNHFGEGLIQRMPRFFIFDFLLLVNWYQNFVEFLKLWCYFRCRHGYFHVVNNDYTHWEMYAIGGSANPTINSQGNRFLAPGNRFAKEVFDKSRLDQLFSNLEK